MPLIETSVREWIKMARTEFVEISGARNLFSYIYCIFPLRMINADILWIKQIQNYKF